MITPEEIKIKAQRIWNSGQFLKSWCSGENLFPIEIPFGKISGSSISENYSETGRAFEKLIEASKDKTGKGYSIGFRRVSHRQLGKQNIPERIFIETEEDLLSLCGKRNEFKIFKELNLQTEQILPALCGFICNHPLTLIEHKSVWEKLLHVCIFFLNNPDPAIYIRQIVIPGIDTKFIESNKKIISELLIFLNPEKYTNTFPGFSQHGFEKYFGLLYDEPLIRFRILDDRFFIHGLSDLTLPVSQFNSLDLPVKNIFITENKVNGLSFPMVKNSIIIFGLGYGIQILKTIPWLEDREIHYWGDIDTHGFSILSMVRGMFPQCRSFLMDRDTFFAHIAGCVEESEAKRFTGELSSLDDNEMQLFEELKNNSHGRNLRLEQELIGFDFLLEVLKQIEK